MVGRAEAYNFYSTSELIDNLSLNTMIPVNFISSLQSCPPNHTIYFLVQYTRISVDDFFFSASAIQLIKNFFLLFNTPPLERSL